MLAKQGGDAPAEPACTDFLRALSGFCFFTTKALRHEERKEEAMIEKKYDP
ncbi:MAG: hypothetical protein JKY95_19645 [Planctomycetaceae bacterium]|nr:hypothetical protein [Planctomycetaceae bacterium]